MTYKVINDAKETKLTHLKFGYEKSFNCKEALFKPRLPLRLRTMFLTMAEMANVYPSAISF